MREAVAGSCFSSGGGGPLAAAPIGRGVAVVLALAVASFRTGSSEREGGRGEGEGGREGGREGVRG